MNERERYLRTMRFESVDRPPIVMPGPWEQTRARWHEEGLPEGVELHEYFGLEEKLTRRHIAVETQFCPPFEERVVSETDREIVKIDHNGVKVRCLKEGMTMPEFIEYPIKGRESLEWLRERLDPADPTRVDPQWLDKARRAQAEGKVVFTNGGSYFGFLNEHMGTEALMATYFEDPEFVHEVNEMLCRLCEKALATCLPEFAPDDIGYHEDMAFKNGSLISPAMVREFMTPYYRRVTGSAREAGVDLHVMDSDGNIDQLIPLWLECGINVFLPLEIAAGMDPVRLRAEYGREIGMIGGFDKRILASDKAAIVAELERLRPVIEEGGYIPDCDHGVPSDVSFDNIRCFVETLKSMYGL